MGYDQVVHHRGTVIPKRDIDRETERYSTEWEITQRTPEEVRAYLRVTYGDKLAEPPTMRPPRRSDGLNFKEYMKKKSKELNDYEIAEMFGISRTALSNRKKGWTWNRNVE